MNYKELATKIKALTSKADLTDSAETILDLPNQYVEDWSSFIGTSLNAGTLVLRNEVKYLVKQTVVPIESQTPSTQGMLAIYQPYQGKFGYNWVYGEYCEPEFTRYYNGVLYKAIQDPASNIYSPNLVPDIWQLAISEES